MQRSLAVESRCWEHGGDNEGEVGCPHLLVLFEALAGTILRR